LEAEKGFSKTEINKSAPDGHNSNSEIDIRALTGHDLFSEINKRAPTGLEKKSEIDIFALNKPEKWRKIHDGK
jgi:hypothetical protein